MARMNSGNDEGDADQNKGLNARMIQQLEQDNQKQRQELMATQTALYEVEQKVED